MKKLFYIIVLVILSTHISVAQDDDSREKFHLGLKAGANYANIYDSKGEEFTADGRFGFAGGVFFSIPIGKYLGVQPEALISQKGFQGKGVLLGSNYEFTRTTTYLDVPLLIAIKPAQFITILAGPQYSYLLRRKEKFTNNGATILQQQEFENDDIRKNTLCFTGGVDVNVQQHMVVSLRTGWDLRNNSGDGNSTTPRYKNAWYQATIGYRF
ncbi:hypothetical protein AD998_20855 [bacterium 336/3]|nr:hypothetical protein AD998_20855 [bacterium 336/3]